MTNPEPRYGSDPPPILGMLTHLERIEHKLSEARYFHGRLVAKEARYDKLVRQKLRARALDEMLEYMFNCSAFISAARSTYFHLNRATKANDHNKRWLQAQQNLPIHEVGTGIRDMMLHESTPSAGFQVEMPPPRPGETKGDWAVRGLFEPRKATIGIAVEEMLPNLSPEAKALVRSCKTSTQLLTMILRGVEQLVEDARARNMLSEEHAGRPVSTKWTGTKVVA